MNSSQALSACSAADAGKLRFSGGVYQFCNGAQWIATGSKVLSACTAADVGKIRFSNTKIQWCDSTNWRDASFEVCNTVGENCGGGIYVGDFVDNAVTYQLITTPGNCNNSPAPTCNGATDTLELPWASETTTGAAGTNNTNGPGNTTLIVNSPHVFTPAATFCSNMIYAGHDDWYLPARDELGGPMFQNRAAIPGFNIASGNYMSSTQISNSQVWVRDFVGGFEGQAFKTSPFLVRCLRRL